MLASGSFGSGVVTITVACVGAGILTFPTAFLNAGVGLCLIFLTIVGFLTIISIRFLATGVEFLGLGSYEEMARELLGGHWETFVRLVLFFLNYGAMAAFITVLKEMLISIQPQLFPVHHNPGGKHDANDDSASFFALSNPTFLLVIMWACFILPLTLFRSVDSLRFATTLSIGASAFLTACIIVRFFYPEDGDAMLQKGHLVLFEPHVNTTTTTTVAPLHNHNDKYADSDDESPTTTTTAAPTTTSTSGSKRRVARRNVALRPLHDVVPIQREAMNTKATPHQHQVRLHSRATTTDMEATSAPPSSSSAQGGGGGGEEEEDVEGTTYGHQGTSGSTDGDEESNVEGDTPVSPDGDDTSVNDPVDDAAPTTPTNLAPITTTFHQAARDFDPQSSKKKDTKKNEKKLSKKLDKKNDKADKKKSSSHHATNNKKDDNKKEHSEHATTTSTTPRAEKAVLHHRLYTINDVSSNGLEWFHFDFLTLLAIPIMMYSLDCQALTFQVYSGVRGPTTGKLTSMATVATLISCAFYVLFGWFGAMSFGTHTMSNILSNYHPGAHDLLLVVGYAMYSIPVMMNFILVLFICRDGVFNFVYDVNAGEHDTFEHKSAIIPPPSEMGEVGGTGDDDGVSSVSSSNSTIAAHKEHLVKTTPFVLWSLLLSVSSLAIAIWIPGVIVLMGFLGSMFSTTLGFTIPAAYRIQMARMGLVPWGAAVITTEEFGEHNAISPSERVALQHDHHHGVSEEGGGAATTSYGATHDASTQSSSAAPQHHRHYHRRLNKVITRNLFVGTVEMISAYIMFVGGILAAFIGTYISAVQAQQG